MNSSLKSWVQARTDLLQAQQNSREADLNFYSLMSSSPLQMGTIEFSIQELEDALTGLKNSIDKTGLDVNSASTVINAMYNLRSVESKQKNTWLFDPQMSINGSLDFNTNGMQRVNAGLNLVLSLDSFGFDDAKQVKSELELAEANLDNAIASA